MASDAVVSDQYLVERVRAGSEPAFEVLFDRHHGSVLAFCRRMLRSPAEAEDAAQSTFIAAYYDLVRSERPIVLRPWLYAIARHRCLNVLRDRRREPDRAAPEAATDRRAADVVVAREDLRAVLADISGLPDDQRTALVLAELGDHSHEEIAEAIGCRREKIKALVFQARASLIADRAARETACAEVRAQVTTLRGAALRRAVLRRHLRECPGCRAFREDLRGERLSVLLAPLTAIAGLRRLIAGALVGPGPAAEGTATAAGALNAGALAATALAAVTIAGGGSVVPAPAPAPRALAAAGSRGIHAHQIEVAHRSGAGASAGHATRARASGDRHRIGRTAQPNGGDAARPTRSPDARAPEPTGAAEEPSASAPQNARDLTATAGQAATSGPKRKGPGPTPASKHESASTPKQRHPARPGAPPGRAKAVPPGVPPGRAKATPPSTPPSRVKATPPARRPATITPPAERPAKVTAALGQHTPANPPARPLKAGPAEPGSAAATNAATPALAPDASPPEQGVGAKRGRPTS